MLFDKYRKENKQTICILGVLILSAKLAKVDGDFSILEEEEILRIIPHEPEQKSTLKRILKEAADETEDRSIYEDAEHIKKVFDGDQPEMLEFIVAVLYRIAHSDHYYSDEEDQMIKKIAQIFEIKEPLINQVENFFKENLSSNLFFWRKKIA